MKRADRKTKVEAVLRNAQHIAGYEKEAQAAWCRLCRELQAMIEPEARMPRFKGLLRAIWTAATNEQS